MFKREEKSKAPVEACTRCGAEAQWTIWGFRTCLGCRSHWDEHAPTSEQVLERAREQKKPTEQIWTEWTDAWVKAGVKAGAA